MAELLWRWVLKINARAVFLSTLLLLCLVLVALLHRGSRQGAGLRMRGYRARSAVDADAGVRGRRAVLRGDIEDPFTSAFLVAWLDLEASRKREREAARSREVAVAPPPRTPPAQRKPAPPKRRPEPQWVGVIYQGMVVRTDGSRVALVREVKTGTIHTVKVGDSVLANRVDAIEAERALLVAGENEDEIQLRVGVVGRIRKDGP
mgnify:CR=1 FL=1